MCSRFVFMLIIHTDGACFGNPGPMGIGIAIHKDGKPIKKISGYIGKGTNNIAEYTAVLRALKFAKEMNEREVEIRSDSELLIRQMKGEYKTKMPHLKELKKKIDELGKEINVNFKWVPRDENEIADFLSKAAVEKHLEK